VPELPEVETVRSSMAGPLTGGRIVRAEILDPRLVRPFDPQAVAAELEGERVATVERRGKYLVVRFESGRVLLIHLRMTGSFRHAPWGSLGDDPHRRAVLRLDNGSDVAYRDVRRFGTWELLAPGELDAYVAKRLCDTGRPEGLDAGRLPRLRSRRPAVSSMRYVHRQDSHRRSGNVVVSGLPALISHKAEAAAYPEIRS
jgi:formamidopyrimidine-DNA glycosylase